MILHFTLYAICKFILEDFSNVEVLAMLNNEYWLSYGQFSNITIRLSIIFESTRSLLLMCHSFSSPFWLVRLTWELGYVETRVTKSNCRIKLLASTLYSQTIDAPIIINRGLQRKKYSSLRDLKEYFDMWASGCSFLRLCVQTKIWLDKKRHFKSFEIFFLHLDKNSSK